MGKLLNNIKNFADLLAQTTKYLAVSAPDLPVKSGVRRLWQNRQRLLQGL